MQLGMIGLGRMGANMVRRWLKDGHACVVHDVQPSAVAALVEDGAAGAASQQDMVRQLSRPRSIWLILPAAIVDRTLGHLLPLLNAGDSVVDGGNSDYPDDLRRCAQLQARGIHYLHVGTIGGIAGLERGYCLMIGGEPSVVGHMVPIFTSLAPGIEAATRSPSRRSAAGTGTAELGFLHCGPHGAGHFAKMVYNGIEYGVMAAYAEGLNVLRRASLGLPDRQAPGEHNTENATLRDPSLYRLDMNLPDITEVERRGSDLGYWSLDLIAPNLLEDPELPGYDGRISDSGEGHWAIQTAIDEGVQVPVLSVALFERFASRGGADFANRVVSAMRNALGGHAEKLAS